MFLKEIFLSSDNCYVGLKHNGEVMVGTEERLTNSGVNDYEFDRLIWLEEKYKLRKVILDAIKKYQSQYGIYVTNLALTGSLIVNNQSIDMGRLLDVNDNPLDLFEVDDSSVIEVGYNLDNELAIVVSGREVKGEVNIHLITASKIKRLTEKKRNKRLISSDFLNIRRNSSPINNGKRRW